LKTNFENIEIVAFDKLVDICCCEVKEAL